MGSTSVSARLSFDVTAPAEIALQLAAVPGPGVTVTDERFTVDGPVTGRDGYLLRADPGSVTVDYAATVTRTEATPEPVPDLDRLIALRPSRYCPSDKLDGFARHIFGAVGSTLDTVVAIRNWVNAGVEYVPGSSGPTTDAAETLLSGKGVCRDFAHLTVALCRASGIAARVAAVYAPGLTPMDFHLVAEALVDRRWTVWDATGLAPRREFARIATGRDAADVAFATVVSGAADLGDLEILAVAGGDLPPDDGTAVVTLA